MSAQLVRAIHSAVGISAAREDVLASIAAVFASRDEARPEAIERLVGVLNIGATPGALSELLHSRATLLNPFRYERSPDWEYGTHLTRRQLVDELWAGSSAGTNGRGATWARAAFLLAAEQGYPYGFATMLYLLVDPAFEARTGWGASAVTALRAILNEQRGRTAKFTEATSRAGEAILAIIARPSGIEDSQVLRFLAAAEQMSQLARDRVDVQMRLANFVWRVANLAQSRGRTDLREQVNATASRWAIATGEPHFSRWLQEALQAPAREIRTAGSGRVRADDIRRDRRPNGG